MTITRLVAVVAAALLLAGCTGSTTPAAPAVPTLAQASSAKAPTSAAAGGSIASTSDTAAGSPGDAATPASQTHLGKAGSPSALHAAAACIRAHGIPGYQDPIVSADGYAYVDLRSVEDAPQSAQDAIQAACARLIAVAGFDPTAEPPAPPALVQAGVQAARCLRVHGLPNMKDPTAQTPYTPGHGFGLDSSEVPAGGKQSAGFQQATTACRAVLDAEIRASTLSGLGNSNG